MDREEVGSMKRGKKGSFDRGEKGSKQKRCEEKIPSKRMRAGGGKERGREVEKKEDGVRRMGLGKSRKKWGAVSGSKAAREEGIGIEGRRGEEGREWGQRAHFG